MPPLRAQTADALVRVISGKSGQIHASDRPQKPGRLPIFFYTSPRDMRLRPAFDCARIDAHLAHPIQVEGYPRIRQQRATGESGHLTTALRRVTTKLVAFDWHKILDIKPGLYQSFALAIPQA